MASIDIFDHLSFYAPRSEDIEPEGFILDTHTYYPTPGPAPEKTAMTGKLRRINTVTTGC